MTKQLNLRASTHLLIGISLFGLPLLLSSGCQDRSPQRVSGVGSRPTKDKDSTFLVNTVAQGLNDLPRETVLDLQPPAPILDDAKSADGQPVLATCGVTPAVPDGPFNYLAVPNRNAGFRKLGVRRGDVVRFFANYDQEGAEHGYAQVGFFELIVRRLDLNDPDNALIVEGGLNGPVPLPQRIEIWRFSDKRMNEIRQRISRYIQRPNKLVGWEPSPDESALLQLLERANQWLRNSNDESSTWQLEPLLEGLPEKLRNEKPLSQLISRSAMESGQFDVAETRQLQQAIWLRDVSRWAVQEAVSPTEVARALFDWTVRNIQLEPSETSGYVHQPWQVLMYGLGTAEQRAWVFAELCRQQQLDVVMLQAGGKWWLPALVHDGQLYLFDTRLGLPLPGKSPDTVGTLSELLADPSLLDQLSVEGEAEYAITADDLKTVAVALVTSPLQLSKRASALEGALQGDDYVVLAANTHRLVEELRNNSQISEPELWTFPFESVLAEVKMTAQQRVRAAQRFIVFAQRPRLWKARVLHFQGTKDVPSEERNDPLAQPDLGHRQATTLYQHPRIRVPNSTLERLEPGKRAIYEVSKADASYWLGLLSYDLGKYKVAEDWLARRTLSARPDGPWTQGARYNLARTHEALGDLPAAIKLLEASKDSPQRLGNLLRARKLKSQLEMPSENEAPPENHEE